MPHWIFKCPGCESVVDRTFPSFQAMEKTIVLCPVCQDDIDRDIVMERQVSAAGFTIHGYNARTGYQHNTPRSYFEKGDE